MKGGTQHANTIYEVCLGERGRLVRTSSVAVISMTLGSAPHLFPSFLITPSSIFQARRIIGVVWLSIGCWTIIDISELVFTSAASPKIDRVSHLIRLDAGRHSLGSD